MADDEPVDDEMDDEMESDEEEDEDSEPESSNGKSGLVDTLMTQLGEHKEVLGPVATSAAAAAATYAAKKLPDLIDRLEQSGGDRIKSRIEDAKDSGGVKGFVSGAASRAFSGGGGSLLDRLKQGGEDEAKSEAKDRAKQSGGITGVAAKIGDKVKGGKGEGGQGWGRGRRLPIIRSIDVAAPIDTVYDQWTQFEEMASFMHRTEAVEQQEPETVVWHENIWGRKRLWNVVIEEQIPKERIQWKIEGGGEGIGVITFHELAPRLTRIEVVFDWQPKGIVEKLGSGLRVHKRAAKTDLYRFKAFVETRGEATGGWRGRIEDAKAKSDTRNKRNTESDPIPTEARQHSEEDERKEIEKGENGGKESSGDDGREAARKERRRHREQRGTARKR